MMHHQQQESTTTPMARKALYLAAAASLLGVTNAGAGPWSTTTSAMRRRSPPLAFASPKASSSNSKTNASAATNKRRERESNVCLFSRGPDTLLSTASLSYTSESLVATTDPFDPSFRPPPSLSLDHDWGPLPMAVIAPESLTAIAAVAGGTTQDAPTEFTIFCDLDGVLVDFEKGVQSICQGKSTEELSKTSMWHQIAQAETAFFEELSWTHDGPKLWNAIRDLQPTILTGVPDLKASRQEKFDWCQQNLEMEGGYRHVDMAGYGYHHDNVNGIPKACRELESAVTNVITCWSYNKHKESGAGAVLIDDRIALKESWEASGGIFVHHTDTTTTLQVLTDLGVFNGSKGDDKLMP